MSKNQSFVTIVNFSLDNICWIVQSTSTKKPSVFSISEQYSRDFPNLKSNNCNMGWS